MGFVRDALIALSFGSGAETDAYFVALTATGIFTALIWTDINTALLPMLSKIEHKEGVNEKKYHVNNVVNCVFIVTLILTIIGWFTAPYIVRIIAVGFEGEQYNLTVLLTRIGLPKIMFSGSIGIIIAFLHSEKRFYSASSIHYSQQLYLSMLGE